MVYTYIKIIGSSPASQAMARLLLLSRDRCTLDLKAVDLKQAGQCKWAWIE